MTKLPSVCWICNPLDFGFQLLIRPFSICRFGCNVPSDCYGANSHAWNKQFTCFMNDLHLSDFVCCCKKSRLMLFEEVHSFLLELKEVPGALQVSKLLRIVTSCIILTLGAGFVLHLTVFSVSDDMVLKSICCGGGLATAFFSSQSGKRNVAIRKDSLDAFIILKLFVDYHFSNFYY